MYSVAAAEDCLQSLQLADIFLSPLVSVSTEMREVEEQEEIEGSRSEK